MIAHLSGTLLKKTTKALIINNGGIGYEVIVPLSTFYSMPEETEEVSLHIYTHVREDTLALFGFRTGLEKEIFLMLLSVTGIGPKLAVNILSGIGPHELVSAIAQEDTVRLQTIPGVGKKMAQRIALELKDKALGVGVEIPTIPTQILSGEGRKVRDDALSALLNLGYPAKSARRAVEKAFSVMKDDNLETLIKESLKLIA